MPDDVDNLFMFLFSIYISSLVMFLLKYFAHFFPQLGCFVNVEFWEFNMYSAYKSLVRYVV